ncbi:MAG TPA: EAL domain-containing protein [Gemmataceae bacterium]|nr:EAL domain-containing protein [Gemmataceae bacterium]
MPSLPTTMTSAEPGDRRDLNAVIVDTSASLIVVFDVAGRIVRFNHACEGATGYTFDEVRGRVFWEFLLDPADATQAREVFERVAAGRGELPRNIENDWLARDGGRRRVVWSNSVVRDDAGAVELVVACGIDITERRQVEVRLRESEERYTLAVRGANDGLWDWNLKTDELYLSGRWKAMVGCAEGDIGSSPEHWFARVHPEDAAELKDAIAQHLAGQTPHVEVEHRLRHRNGQWRWMLARGLAIFDAAGVPYRMAGSLTDVTDRKADEAQLVHDTLHDSLTGLANRVFLEHRIEHVLNRSRRDAAVQFAVLFIDLDRFKIVNDGLGHPVGDQLLVRVAERLRQCVRPADTVARVGGDEFVILLEDVRDETDPARVADRVQELLKEPVELDGHEVFTSASIGIAPGSPRYRGVQDILRDADAAMYRAKALGKNRHAMFDDAMHARAMEVLKLETDLRRAIERKEFLLHYQPIVSLADGSLRGFEALVRWRHPDRGMVSPAVFIPMMEETGLIVPLGSWVLAEACRQLRAWRDAFPQAGGLSVNVNVSGKQFAKVDLVAEVEAALAAGGLAGRSICLEITESVMMSNSDAAAATLAELRRRGVSIAVDDFGMGYSSLGQLHRFPIDALKVDRAFVQRIGGGGGGACADAPGRDAEIIGTIVTLAKNLNLCVTAEGIETPLQLERLKALGCELGQGYLFAKPMGPEAVEAILAGVTPWGRAGLLAG